ncbi:50S ribosomal protein L13 [Buchnera aphidicola (Schlechtendalia chinensis)]|uniref:Large ribosomal subunit protein uL13 n=1 Tax=Buchnera aphidicola subsp. Schlechtendalia chinensis TaxID=118110 RepID=A0A172WDR9_BUCSC|nr:50S ribosomal protein L13 [Buchnera aphidicola]ANF17126.1 50S ribosomal protein L13 [Buchnera aphidicola (Schlechtendalia chinensis)]
MKSFSAKTQSIVRTWYCIDATGKILGRLSSYVAARLRGKHKVEYTPHVDVGDYLIVINASKILVTGKKYINKYYYRHTGYVGGIKKFTFKDMISRFPTRVIEIAVRGMLPKGPLGREMFKKLKVYSDNDHIHIAQNPKMLII